MGNSILFGKDRKTYQIMQIIFRFFVK